MAEGKISDAGRASRFARWDKIGVERIKADLLQGGHRLVGGSPAVRELAWEWVKLKEAEKEEVVKLKPTLWGIGVDLKVAWRKWFRRKPQ